jgi:NAD(P)H-quinone oxidoreductase subunit 5
LWLPKPSPQRKGVVTARLLAALGTATFLTVATYIVDHAPVGAGETPLEGAGIFALAGMMVMYFEMAAFQLWPHSLITLRRWVYAGFYMDEGYTHWVLRLWPKRWADARPIRDAAIISRSSAPTHSEA